MWRRKNFVRQLAANSHKGSIFVPANRPVSPITKDCFILQNRVEIRHSVEILYGFRTNKSLMMRVGLVRVRKGNPQMGKKR